MLAVVGAGTTLRRLAHFDLPGVFPLSEGYGSCLPESIRLPPASQLDSERGRITRSVLSGKGAGPAAEDEQWIAYERVI
jgi:hypothetical protein